MIKEKGFIIKIDEISSFLIRLDRDDLEDLRKRLYKIDDSFDHFLGWRLDQIFKNIDINYDLFLHEFSKLIIIENCVFMLKKYFMED